MTHIIPAEFFGTPLDIIDHDGKKWLTAEQVGLALGYNEANASQGVLNLYNRHKNEFTEADTCQINLMRQSANGINQFREARIFSSSGSILLSFFAGTKKAVAFRAWAKKNLAAQLDGSAATVSADKLIRLEGELAAARAALLRVNPTWAAAIRYRAAGLSYREVGRLLGKSRDAVDKIYHAIRAAGLELAAPRLKGPSRLPAVFRHRAPRQEAAGGHHA